ncbi:MAG: insulinase family protein [Bacteroidaceae bacterium]|nr:insulinase family protein [Bacteroidaceae bacterium]
MNLRFLFSAAVLVFATQLCAQGMEQMMQPLPLDPKVTYGKLDNGLTYYVRHNEYPKGQANFYIAQKVGSVLEEEDQRGLAHFLEHMCFNGTENFPENSLIRYLETLGVKFGAQLNAYTSVDETVYNINNVPTQREATIDSVLLILHDWSHNLTLDPAEIDKERGVIHEEWRLRTGAMNRIIERQGPKLHSNSRPGSRFPIGLMSVVDNFKPEALRAYYEKWYRPDLQAIIVVGDIDVERTVQRIKDMFGPIPAVENPAVREYFTVPQNDEPIIVSDHDKEQTIPLVMISYKHEELLPREMRNTIPFLSVSYIKSMAMQMLNKRLDEIALDPDCPFIQAGVEDGDFLLSKSPAFQITILPKEGRLDEAIQKVMAEVYRAANHGFTGSEYGRVRSEFLSQIEAAYNNRETTQTANYIHECVRNFLDNEAMPGIEFENMLYGAMAPQMPVEMPNEMIKNLVSVSDTNLVVLSINPEKEGYQQPTEEQLLRAIHAAQQMNLPAYVDNVKNEPLIAKLPKPGKIKKEEPGQFGTTILTLSNGARVILKKTDYQDNQVLMRAYSDGGTGRYGAEDKYTISLADMLIGASGLGNFTDTELDKALAGIQASVSPSMSSRSEFLRGDAVPKDLRTMFELIYLHFGDLKRDDKAAASALNQMKEMLRNQAANPMRAFSDSLQTTLYGKDNPRLVLMNEENVDKASYDRVLEIYRDRFQGANDFTFVFVGNFDEDSIRHFVRQYIAPLPKVKRNDKAVDNHYNIREGEYTNRFLRKMEEPQTAMIQYLQAPIENTLHNQLTADILGQVLTMRLLEVVREDMGAAYTISASCDVRKISDGSCRANIQIYAPVKPEMCDSALLVIDQELQKVAREGAEDKYVSKVKEYLLKTYTENERKNGTWLEYIEEYDRDHLDTYTDYRQAVQAITSDDLAALAKRILDSKNHIIVIMLPEE